MSTQCRQKATSYLVEFTASGVSSIHLASPRCRFHMFNGNKPPLTPGDKSEIFAQPSESRASSVKVCLDDYVLFRDAYSCLSAEMS